MQTGYETNLYVTKKMIVDKAKKKYNYDISDRMCASVIMRLRKILDIDNLIDKEVRLALMRNSVILKNKENKKNNGKTL